MTDKKILGFQHLERNLEAMIHEGFVKIGYVQGEKISIYYFSDLLSYLLDIDNNEDLIRNLTAPLHEFCNYMIDNWGFIHIEREKNRYQFIIPAKGTAYVYEKNKNNTFLSDLIQTLSKNNCTVDDILPVFQKYSNEVVCEQSTHPEFDYVIYFADSNIDEFRYCFTFGELGKYYHRLTEYDYSQLED